MSFCQPGKCFTLFYPVGFLIISYNQEWRNLSMNFSKHETINGDARKRSVVSDKEFNLKNLLVKKQESHSRQDGISAIKTTDKSLPRPQWIEGIVPWIILTTNANLLASSETWSQNHKVVKPSRKHSLAKGLPSPAPVSGWYNGYCQPIQAINHLKMCTLRTSHNTSKKYPNPLRIIFKFCPGKCSTHEFWLRVCCTIS